MPETTESYLREKFGEALMKLAAGTEALPERVRAAIFVLVMFRPEDMPDQWSRDTFAKLSYLSTDRQATEGEGDVAATLERMSTEKVQDLARSIVELHHHLDRRSDPRYAADQVPLGDEDPA